MASEREWVHAQIRRFREALKGLEPEGGGIDVQGGRRLVYAHEVMSYEGDARIPSVETYETDLLVFDTHDERRWVPRLVIECKLGSITTHDALTYSAKAATHKNVHPYLRYGILVAGFDAIPGRLLRHGAHFDLMATWAGEEPTPAEWGKLVAALREEVQASRKLEQIMTTSRERGRSRFSLVHRPLRVE